MTPEIVNALIAAGSGLGGVALGGYLAARSQDKDRLEARRERLRSAYGDWLAAADELSKCDERTLATMVHAEVLFARDVDKFNAAMADRWKEQTDALSRETSAFYRLALAEPSRDRTKRVDALRQIRPFLTAAETTDLDKQEVFSELWRKQSAGMADIIVEVNEQLRMDDV